MVRSRGHRPADPFPAPAGDCSGDTVTPALPPLGLYLGSCAARRGGEDDPFAVLACGGAPAKIQAELQRRLRSGGGVGLSDRPSPPPTAAPCSSPRPAPPRGPRGGGSGAGRRGVRRGRAAPLRLGVLLSAGGSFPPVSGPRREAAEAQSPSPAARSGESPLPTAPSASPRRLFTSACGSAMSNAQVDLSDDSTAGAGGKPKLLCDMEAHLARELRVVPADDAAGRLRVYRSCLSLFISQSRVYGPLLSAVMREYDGIISRQAAEQTRLARREDGLARLREEHDAAAAALERERGELRSEREQMRSQLAAAHRERDAAGRSAQEELQLLQQRVAQLTLEKKEEESKVATLVQTVREAEIQGREKGDRVLKLQDENRKVMGWSDELRALRAKFDEYQKKMEGAVALCEHEALERELAECREQMDELVTDKGRIRAALRLKEQDYEKVIRALRQARGDAERLRQDNGAMTPRPQWQEVLDGMGYEGADGRSSWQLAQELRQALDEQRKRAESLQGELNELQRKFHILGGDAAVALATGGQPVADPDDWFVGLGTAPHVPRCLRWYGKLRNRRLEKAEVEGLIHEIWTKKVEYDKELPQGQESELGTFLQLYLREQCGSPAAAAELAYSLRDGCIRFRSDPDCGLFIRILEGDLPERLHGDQLHMLEDLQMKIMPLEKQGKVRKKQIMDLLPKLFPAKTQANLVKLNAELTKDVQGGFIDAQELFSEDEEGTQSAFVEALRAQYNEESCDYITELSHAIFKESVETEDGLWTVTPEAAVRAVCEVDSKKPIDELRQMVLNGVGSKGPWEELSLQEPLPLETFVRRLVSFRVARSTRPREMPARVLSPRGKRGTGYNFSFSQTLTQSAGRTTAPPAAAERKASRLSVTELVSSSGAVSPDAMPSPSATKSSAGADPGAAASGGVNAVG